ncbi:MAG TPA: hypothetical protein VMV69_14825 [Pirellulales bacterium]|nr:hypothetical protein [Pirellulales bacterium]
MPDALEILFRGPVSQGVQQVEDQPFEKYRRRLPDSIQKFSRNRTVDFSERGVKPFVWSLLCGGSADVDSIIVASVRVASRDSRMSCRAVSSSNPCGWLASKSRPRTVIRQMPLLGFST